MSRIDESLIAALVLVAVVILPLHAQEIPSPDEKSIDQLIEHLGDENLETQEAATEELVEIGTPALSRVEIAMESTDPEVAIRAKGIAQRIRMNLIEGGKPINGLQAVLRSKKTSYKIGETVPLALVVRNVSGGSRTITPLNIRNWSVNLPSVKIACGYTASHGSLSVKFVGEMGDRAASRGISRGSGPDRTPVELKSGEERSTTIDLVPLEQDKAHISGDRLTLPLVPGTYEIQWEYDAKSLLPDMPEDLVSNTLTIRVTKE